MSKQTIFLSTLVLASLLVILGCGGETTDEKETTAELEAVDSIIEVSDSDFGEIVTDLISITDDGNLSSLVNTGDIESRDALADSFLSLSTGKGIYDQIRYLNESGDEIVRVDYKAGNPVIVEDENLQNKGGRYYFEDTAKLGVGEIFVSPLDLNMEHGEIEMPIKPVIRFGTPIFNAKGEKKGIIIINYLASSLLENIKSAAENASGELMLVNNEGYWLISTDETAEWAFMYDGRQGMRFKENYNSSWLKMTNNESGHIESEAGDFTYGTVYPLITAWKYSNISDYRGISSSEGAREAFEESTSSFKGTDYFWKVILFIPAE